MPTFLLAIGIEQIGTIVVIVLTILGALSNFISNKKNEPPAKAPGRRPARPAPPRDKKISDEIEVFLQEVTGRKKPPQQQATVPDDEIEVIDEPAPRQRSDRSPKPLNRPQRPRQPKPVARPVSVRETQPVTDPGQREHAGSSELGTNIRSHVSTYMDSSRIKKQVAEDIGHDVDESVRTHLGQFSPDFYQNELAGDQSLISQHSLVKLLRDPAGVRQAILIREVLERPSVSRRRR